MDYSSTRPKQKSQAGECQAYLSGAGAAQVRGMQIDESAGSILEEYPRYCFLWQTFRDMALNHYSACGAGPCQRTGFSKTDSAAVLLTIIDERSELTKMVGRWIETELLPEDRETLIRRWRGWRWNTARWAAMVTALKVYVGHASAVGGNAFADGRTTQRGAR
jgi:hypothetical protein